MSQTPAIIATELSKTYRAKRGRPAKTAVHALDLELPVGQTLGLLGANGAGKTTTVEMLAGLRRPTTGSVRILGLDPVRARSEVRQLVGVQLQNADLHNALTATELLRLYASFYPEPRAAQDALEMVDLTDQAGVRFEKLSGGQKQRLSVALALIGRPRVVILDEVSTGLDPRARRRVWAALKALRADGVSIVLVSHAMDEVERLCDRIVMLDQGRVVAAGTPAQVTERTGAENLEEAFVQITGHDLDDEREAS